MKLRALLAGLLVTVATAKAACIAPDSSPCRTLEYDTSSWDEGSGQRYRLHRVEAVAGGGRAMIRESREIFRLYLLAAKVYDRARIILPAQQRTVEVEYTHREFQDLGGLWWFNGRWSGEADCFRRAAVQEIEGAVLANGFQKSGRVVQVAGVAAIEYVRRYQREGRMIAETKALAPALGCTEVSFVRAERNAYGLPVAGFVSELTALAWDEPHRELFEVPGNYREVRYYRERRQVPEWPYLPDLSFSHGR